MKRINQHSRISYLPLCALALLSFVSNASAQTIIYQDPLLGTAPPDGSAGDDNNINRRQPATDIPDAGWIATDYYGPNLTTAGLADWRYGNNLAATAELPITMDG